MKSFGYPIPTESLAHFLDPDGGRPLLWEDHTYFTTAHWTLRTAQATASCPSPTHPVTPDLQRLLDKFDTIPAKDWKPLDDLAPLLCKFPARIWERTQFRHHLQSYPLVKINATIAQRGILQLATRLPRAEVCTGHQFSDHLAIRFRSGQLLLHPLPYDWRNHKISLHLCQPKDRHPLDR